MSKSSRSDESKIRYRREAEQHDRLSEYLFREADRLDAAARSVRGLFARFRAGRKRAKAARCRERAFVCCASAATTGEIANIIAKCPSQRQVPQATSMPDSMADELRRIDRLCAEDDYRHDECDLDDHYLHDEYDLDDDLHSDVPVWRDDRNHPDVDWDSCDDIIADLIENNVGDWGD